MQLLMETLVLKGKVWLCRFLSCFYPFFLPDWSRSSFISRFDQLPHSLVMMTSRNNWADFWFTRSATWVWYQTRVIIKLIKVINNEWRLQTLMVLIDVELLAWRSNTRFKKAWKALTIYKIYVKGMDVSNKKEEWIVWWKVCFHGVMEIYFNFSWSVFPISVFSCASCHTKFWPFWSSSFSACLKKSFFPYFERSASTPPRKKSLFKHPLKCDLISQGYLFGGITEQK